MKQKNDNGQALEVLQTEPITNVYDEETGNIHKVTPERHRQAAYVHQQVMMGAFITAFAVKKMFDEKLYLELGCGSKDEYCEQMLPFGKRQAYRYYAVADRFQKYLPITESGEIKEIGEGVPDLGMVKLYELSKLEQDDLDSFMDGEDVDGLNKKDATAMTANALRNQIKDIRKKYSARVTNLEEREKELKEKLKLREQELAGVEDLKKEHDLLKNHFDAKAENLKEKTLAMDRLQRILHDLQPALWNCNINLEDPLTLQTEFVQKLNHLKMIYDHAYTNYGDVILAYVEDNS